MFMIDMMNDLMRTYAGTEVGVITPGRVAFSPSRRQRAQRDLLATNFWLLRPIGCFDKLVFTSQAAGTSTQ
ncbi:MAG: hypothetical protein ACRYGR_03245 [Janthinobacterium lividum]